MNEMIKIAAFLKKHRVRSWSRKALLDWLRWHINRGHVCCIEENGKIVAVGVARQIKSPNECGIHYANHEEGKILFVEQVAVKCSSGLRDLLKFCKSNWPQCDKILFSRKKNDHIMKLYDFNKFLEKAGI